MGLTLRLTDRPALAKAPSQRRTAQELSFIYVDTGALYRALAVFLCWMRGSLRRTQRNSGRGRKERKVSIAYENGEQHCTGKW